MERFFPEGQKKITVAVAFDEHLEHVLAVAEPLARRLGATLRFVHVSDPWTKSYLATAVESGPSDLAQTLQDEATRVAEERLAATAATLPNDIPVETVVLEGEVTHALTQDIAENGSGLVLIGAQKGPISTTTLGFSTAVSLIMETTTPVMVLNESAGAEMSRETLRLLASDDLSENSERTMNFAFQFAEALGNTQLTHVHVQSFPEVRKLRHVPKEKSEAGSGKALTPAAINDGYKQSEDAMDRRSGDYLESLKRTGGSYRKEIVAGVVADELEKSATAARSDLAIFGQHRVFHRRPLHVGQVPFKAMLSQIRAVVVVPPTE